MICYNNEYVDYRKGLQMIFVTGATGHIGNNLVRLLLEKNIEFTILQRKSGKALSDLDARTIEGDIFDPHFLAANVKPGDILVHMAALIDLSNKQTELSEQVNNLGTRSIVDFCFQNSVRLVYTSSVDVIYREKQQKIIQEPKQIRPELLKSTYAITKAKGTEYLFDKMKNAGMDAVILYPSAVIGVNDYKPSAAGNEIAKSLRRKLFFYIEGGYNFIDVRDCAKAILTCIEKPITGNYILSGYNCTLKEFYQRIAAFNDRKAMYLPIPAFFAKAFVFLIPRFSKVMIDAVLDNYHYDNSKMMRDLIPSLTPFDTTVSDTIKWFQDRH